ncbi:acyltransferase family protein [Ruegeria sp. HKCCD7255]|uniref:acyltransferase family protein n=1 Tax=Ruegeria sp. HKCCD7255 TaxID=2683004 RepID=UPI001C2BE914|nr:acyltransferase family protein [Ruegeria sp. HKCCD7255]
MNRLSTDSQIISVTRFLCIFCMMYVHVNPGSHQESAVMTGDYQILAWLLIEMSGRASVAALSTISGFLLYDTVIRGLLKSIKDRFIVLYVPMITWNVITIALALLALSAGISTTTAQILKSGSQLDLLNNVTGLFDKTLGLPLFFLRDLFVSSCIIALARPLIVAFPLVSVVVGLAAYFTDSLEPLVFRESILLFMLFGFVLRHKRVSLAQMADLKIAIPAFISFFALMLFMSQTQPDSSQIQNVVHLASNLFKRLALVFGFLALSLVAVKIHFSGFFVKREPFIYPAFLSHAIVISTLYQILVHIGLDPNQPIYVLFFLGAPVIALFCGSILYKVALRLPSTLSVLLIGKKTHRKSVARGQEAT